MVREVDLRLEMECWVCSRCPAAGPARPLKLRPLLAASPVLSSAMEPTLVVPGEQAQPATPAVPATPSPATIALEAPATPSPSALARRGAVTPPDPPAPLASELTSRSVMPPIRVSTCRCSSSRRACSTPKHAPNGEHTARLFLSIRHVRATVDHYLARPDGFDAGRLQHFLDTAVEVDPRATIFSVDAVGAFNL